MDGFENWKRPGGVKVSHTAGRYGGGRLGSVVSLESSVVDRLHSES